MAKAFHVSVSPYRFIFMAEDGKGRGNRCSMICAILSAFFLFFFCFFQLNSPLPSSLSHSLWQRCISPFRAFFPCFSLKLPKVWNFEKNNTAGKRNRVVFSGLTIQDEFSSFLKCFRLRLHGLRFLYIFFWRFQWDLTHADCIRKMKGNTKSINMS